MNQQSIGFWSGLGMAWTATIQTVVKALRMLEVTADAGLNVAESANKGTLVMKENVNNWATEELIKTELAKVAAETKRLNHTTAVA